MRVRVLDYILDAAKMCGSFEPNQNMVFYEENLYLGEVKEVEDFLTWMHRNGKTMGYGNYRQVYKEYLETVKKK